MYHIPLPLMLPVDLSFKDGKNEIKVGVTQALASGAPGCGLLPWFKLLRNLHQNRVLEEKIEIKQRISWLLGGGDSVEFRKHLVKVMTCIVLGYLSKIQRRDQSWLRPMRPPGGGASFYRQRT